MRWVINKLPSLNSFLLDDVSDSYVPRPSLHTVDSQTSLEANDSEVIKEGISKDEEVAFDEEGLLFGDRKLLMM